MTFGAPISTEKLLSYSVNLIRRVQRRIDARLRFSPEAALQRIPDPKKDANNQPLRIDYYAEDYYGGGLEKRFKDKICAIGEETLERRPDLHDISGRSEVFAIMDIIDGTDLLFRRLENWCSAIVFFYPPTQQILLSIVADHNGDVFYATHDRPGAFFYSSECKSLSEAAALTGASRPEDREDAFVRLVRRRSSGPVATVSLCDASICFVGQKPPHFLGVAENAGFCAKLNELKRVLDAKTRPAPGFRIYNLGGIPMMPKVANGIVDAVIGFKRSKPHDFVAGAFIALKAGAFLGDMGGRSIDQNMLAMTLNRPKQKCDPYILSCTRSLYDELLGSIK